MNVFKFGAIWCPTCLVMKPRWQEVEKQLKWLETEYFDMDQDTELVKKYEIDDPPVFVFLDKDGKEFTRRKGDISRKKLIKFLEENREK